jgi:hypothetical protein
MLITNSEERATIQEIFEDKWFQVDLPDYLKNPAQNAQIIPPKSRQKPTKIDETIAAKVAEVYILSNSLTNRVSDTQSKMSSVSSYNQETVQQRKHTTSLPKQKKSTNPLKKLSKEDLQRMSPTSLQVHPPGTTQISKNVSPTLEIIQ